MSEPSANVTHFEPPPFEKIDPDAFTAAAVSIPALQDLATLDQWVCWRPKRAGGKWTKPPCRPDGAICDAHDPANWRSLEKCLDGVRGGPVYGVGFVTTADDPYVLIDFDHCRDPEAGTLDDESMREVAALRSYGEVSVSGSGVHVIAKLDDPERQLLDGMDGGKREGVEIYRAKRFFTFTGEHLAGTPDEIIEANDAVQSLWRRRVKPEGHKAGSASADAAAIELPAELPELDQKKLKALIDNEPKFRASWECRRREPNFLKADGVTPDWSSYDQSLMNFAAEASWPDGQMQALLFAFRAKHGANPGKALRPEYVRGTIKEARTSIAQRQTKQEAAQPAPEPASIEQFLRNRDAAAAYHGFGGHADRGTRDCSLAQLAGAAGLDEAAVRDVLTSAAPVGGVAAPEDLDELLATARASRSKREDEASPLGLVRACLGVPVRRVVALVGAGKNPSVAAFALEVEDGRRVHLGDGDVIQNQRHVRGAFIKAGLPAFGSIKSPRWFELIRALQTAAEQELAGDLDDATRLAGLLEREMRASGSKWPTAPKDGGEDPEAFYRFILALDRNPHPFVYSQAEGLLWVPWTFIDGCIARNAHRSIDRWSAQKIATLLKDDLGWRGKQLQIVVPAPPPPSDGGGAPPKSPRRSRVVKVSAWAPPEALIAELGGEPAKATPA